MEYTGEPFICSFDGCKKVYKSKCGLKIHSRVYMPSLLNIKVEEFDIDELKVIVKDSLIKLSIDSCCSDKVRDVFKNFKIEESEEGPADIMCIVQITKVIQNYFSMTYLSIAVVVITSQKN